jgi:predicted kinase
MALVLMCGLSFAGKSTLAASLADGLGAERVSLDAINAERGLDGGQGIPLEEWARTNDLAHARAGALLRAGRPVVVDDTGSPRFIRDGWRAVAEEASAPFALVWVRISPELQRERLLANRAEAVRPDVVDAVIADHVAGFEEPAADESPIVIDAAATRDADEIGRVLAAIRAG